MVTATPAAAATVVVNQNHEQGWHMEHTLGERCATTGGPGSNTGKQTFEPGPQGAPGAPGKNPDVDDDPNNNPDDVDSDSPNGGPPGPSSGSLEFSVGDNGWTVEQFRNTNYENTKITDIKSLDYWTYEEPDKNDEDGQPDPLTTPPAVYIRLVIDKDAGAGTELDTLVFEPAYQQSEGQHEVDWGAWQQWVADDDDAGATETSPEGLWWLESKGAGPREPRPFRTLDKWVQDEDGEDWRIVNPGGKGGVILGAGCGHPGPWRYFVGNTDRFTIEIEGQESTTYDFEPGVPTDQATLDCEPETKDNPTGTNHTITCTATTAEAGGNKIPARGRRVHIEAAGANDPDASDSKASPDFSCTTDNEGKCSVTHGPTGADPEPTGGAGTTVYTAWIDVDDKTIEADTRETRDAQGSGAGDDPEGDGTDVVEKNWVGRAALGGGVDAEPESGSHELGVNHTITATVYDQTGDPLTGDTKVNFEFFVDSPSDEDGNTPGSPDATCSTNDSSKCKLTYTEASSVGTDRICVFTNDAPAMTGGGSTSSCGGESASDSDDSPDAPDAPSPANDDQDVVTHTWTRRTVRQLECDPETQTSPTGSAHVISCTASSTDGTDMPGVEIDVEIVGANDPDAGDSPTTPDLTCITGTDGSCSLRHGSRDTATSSAGSTSYRAWVDTDQADSTAEADRSEGQADSSTPGQQPEPDTTDVVTVTWEASPLECEPETGSGPVGVDHDFHCTSDVAVSIDVEITGANDPDDSDSPQTPDLTCETESDGRCLLSHRAGGGSSEETGSTLYRVWIDSDDSDPSTEADATEGQDESTTPGETPESDMTEVVEHTWTNDPIKQCNDGVDNDGDGSVDHLEDPDCSSSADDDEQGARATCPGFESDPRNQIVGSSGPETLEGSAGDDIICGRGGRDIVLGLEGDDLLIGGRGRDSLRGGGGGDHLRGRTGHDKIWGGRQRDRIDGGRGRDRCVGGPGGATMQRCEGR